MADKDQSDSTTPTTASSLATPGPASQKVVTRGKNKMQEQLPSIPKKQRRSPATQSSQTTQHDEFLEPEEGLQEALERREDFLNMLAADSFSQEERRLIRDHFT